MCRLITKIKVTLLAIVGIFATGHVAAMGFGSAEVRSNLGQPLNVVIPVLSGRADELMDNCFSIAQPSQASDTLPALSKASLVLKNASSSPYLLLTTRNVVNEPVLVFAIEARCANTVHRDYTLLLDVPSRAGNIGDNARQVVALPSTAKSAIAQTQPKPVLSNSKRTHVSKQRTRSARQSVSIPPPSTQPASDIALRMSDGLAWLPGEHPLSAEQSVELKRMRGMLSIGAGGQTAEVDRLRDDIVATQQQLAQAKQALALLKAQMPNPAAIQKQLSTAPVKHISSWWQSGWLWISLALAVILIAYIFDRRKKLPNFSFAPETEDLSGTNEFKPDADAIDSSAKIERQHIRTLLRRCCPRIIMMLIFL